MLKNTFNHVADFLKTEDFKQFMQTPILTTMFAAMTSGSTHTDSTKKVSKPNRKSCKGGRKKEYT